MTSSSDSRSPSSSASIRALVRSSLRLLAPGVDHRLVVDDQPQRRLGAGLRDVVHAVLAVHHDVGLATDLGAVLLGDAHHLGDDVHREAAGEVGDPVDALPVPGLVQALGEVAVGELLDARQQVVDAARCEAAGDERAQPVLARRVHAQDRHHLVRVGSPGGLLDRDAPRVGVDVVALERRGDVLVPHQRPEVEAPGCGAAARSRAARRTSGRGRSGTCSRRGRGRPGPAWRRVMRCPSITVATSASNRAARSS